MENLREKVYECTLAVEAHMIVDLLARAGISARVDGEFLAGAGGELPLGSTIKVRVDPARAAEARQVIDEWEKAQPAEPTPAIQRPPWRSPIWFVVGGLCGFGVAFAMMRSPITDHGVDYDGDGRRDETWHYAGGIRESTETDRDRDGKVDSRWRYDLRGMPRSLEVDDDFDGRFEWFYEVEDGEITRGTRDADADGKPDEVSNYRHGVLDTLDIYDESGSRVVARQHFVRDSLAWTEFDRDGDATFEERVEFDRYTLPK